MHGAGVRPCGERHKAKGLRLIVSKGIILSGLKGYKSKLHPVVLAAHAVIAVVKMRRSRR